jgi:hypothetical protein
MGAPLPAGAPFVLLDQHIVTVASGLNALDRALQLRLVAQGFDHADPTALALSVAPQATALKPLSPVHLKARRNAGGVTLSWVRRTRIDGDGWVGEVPLGEDREQYVVEILSGENAIRTIDASSPSVLYPSTDESADFGHPQSHLSVRVSQLSATVGRGFFTQAILQT